MRAELTFEDIQKLKRAYDDLSRILDGIEKTNRKRDEDKKPSSLITDAHRCLHEVLFG